MNWRDRFKFLAGEPSPKPHSIGGVSVSAVPHGPNCFRIEASGEIDGKCRFVLDLIAEALATSDYTFKRTVGESPEDIYTPRSPNPLTLQRIDNACIAVANSIPTRTALTARYHAAKQREQPQAHSRWITLRNNIASFLEKHDFNMDSKQTVHLLLIIDRHSSRGLKISPLVEAIAQFLKDEGFGIVIEDMKSKLAEVIKPFVGVQRER